MMQCTLFLTLKNELKLKYPLHDKVSLFLILFFVSTPFLRGQKKEVIKENSQWIQYYNQSVISDKWQILFDAGYRWLDGFEERSQYIIRAGIGYRPVSRLRLVAGFAHLGFYSSGDLTKTEYRPYQEIGLTNKLNKIDLSHRLRIEERFFKEQHPQPFQDAQSFNFRFRYLFAVGIPLVQFDGHRGSELSLHLGDEIFINAGADIVNNVFDQNRLLVSPTYRLNEQFSFALTYNYIFAGTAQAGQYASLQVWWLQIKQNLDFRRKSKAELK